MNIEFARSLVADVESAHHALCAAAYGHMHGTKDWGAVSRAIRAEGEAIGRLRAEIPLPPPQTDPDERREAAREARESMWHGGR